MSEALSNRETNDSNAPDGGTGEEEDPIVDWVGNFLQEGLEEMPTLTYSIKVNGRETGKMELKEGEKWVEAKYPGVGSDDRLPFASSDATKKSQFELENGVFSLKSLKLEEGHYDFCLRSEAPPEVRAEVPGKGERLIMVDYKTGLPRLIMDPIPAASFETLLVNVKQKKISLEEGEQSQDMMLVEGGAPMKVYFKREGKDYVCYRRNVPGQPSAPLFKCNEDVTKVESVSGRWSLSLK